MADDTKARQAARDMGETVREEARRTGETVREEAKAVADEARTVGREHAEQRFEQGKSALDDQVDTIHSAVDGAARRLREEDSPLASYADELSGQLARLSDGIQNSSLDDLAIKTRRVARENPGLFVLGSIVAGIAAGRFFKASSERDHDDHDHYDDARGSDDYRAGREAAMAGYRRDYRSPIAGGAPAPYRPATVGDGNRASPSVSGGAAGTAGRMPMDSTLAGGAATSSTTTTGSGASGTPSAGTAGNNASTTGAN